MRSDVWRTIAALSGAFLVATVGVAFTGERGSAADGPPSKTEVVSHNDVGGGSDVFTRGAIKLMYENQIIATQWPVVNIPAGDGVGAMAYLASHAGDDDVIAQMTPTWLVTPMTVDDSGVGVADLVPIAGLSTEPLVVAVRAGSPYRSFADFVAAAQERPDALVQAGGSTTATDSLSGLALQHSTQARWKFLSFEDAGSRVTALLRGDADIVLGSPNDFIEQVRAGDLEVITILGSERLELFPNAKTLTDQGIPTDNLPLQFRGILGAPGMSQEALTYYTDSFRAVTETPAWESYAKENGIVTEFRDGPEYREYLEEQRQVLAGLLDQLGLRRSR